MSLSASVALDDDFSPATLAALAGPPDGLGSLGEHGLAASNYGDFGLVSPVTAEIARSLVAAAVTSILREHFRLGDGILPDLPDLAAQLDTAVVRAWRDLTGDWRPQDAALPRAAHADRIALTMALPAAPSALLADGQMCALFAVDIAGYTRPGRDDDIRRYLHEQLYGMLEKAFDSAGIPWAGCWREDRGDGALVVLPPGLAGQGLIHPLPERLRGLVRRHNHVSCDAAQIQLRVAAHIGLVEHDGHGFLGSDVDLLFRMLEARTLKRRLTTSGRDLALIVSDCAYHSLVRRHPSLLGPETFEAIRFQVKNTRARAWTYLPDASR